MFDKVFRVKYFHHLPSPFRRVKGFITLAAFALVVVTGHAQQTVSDAAWSGNWAGRYSYVIDPCGITNAGDISVTLTVTDGVVIGSGTESGVICTDGNCGVTGYGTFSGSLQGAVSNSTINFSGYWYDTCNNQNFPITFAGTLSNGQIIGTDNIALNKLDITNECVIDWNDTCQEIDGFGGASAFVGGWTTQLADMFFSTNKGAGLSLLRSAINPDGTTGETNIMQWAQQRGARVWSSPWSPPADFKDSGSINGGAFLSTFNQAYAEQLANYVLNMKVNYQVNLYAISVQNEPDFTTTVYQSCGWNGQQIHDFIPYLSQALSNNGVGDTKIMIAEQADWLINLAAISMGDPITSNLVGIVAAHDYNYTWGPIYTGNKPLWQTEFSRFTDFDPSMSDGLFWAFYIHQYMTISEADSFNYWWLVPEGNNNQGLTDIYGNPAKRLYVLGQFSRFVRPGFYRMDAFNNSTTEISAYKNPTSGNLAIVAVNPNENAITQDFKLANFTAGFVTPWITDATRSIVSLPAVPITNASFSYTLPAQSVITFVGQTNLTATIEQQPQNQSIFAGDIINLSVGVSGAWPLSYIWEQNGVAIDGATNATYTITNVPASDSGSQFTCVVSNIYGAVTSQVATLTITIPICVEPLSSIMAWWSGDNNAADIVGTNNGVLKDGTGFAAALVGTGFSFNGVSNYVQLPANLYPLPNAQPFSIETWFETSTGGVIMGEQAGAPFGDTSEGWLPQMYVGTDGHVYLQLFWDGAFAQIESTVTVNDGTYHHLAATYDGTNEVGYLDGVEIGEQPLAYSSYSTNFFCQVGTGYAQYWPGGNGGWFTFDGVIDQPTLYSNALSAAQVLAIFNANSAGKCRNQPPLIVSQPINQTVLVGGSTVFSVSASSLAAVTYQWFQGANALPGATNTTLILTDVPISDNGTQFSCVATNIYGTSTSAVASLTVTLFLSCATPPAGLVDWWPGEGNAVDIIGGNNGTLVNGVSFATGEVNQGFSFNGSNSYVQLPENLYPMANAAPFSIELWFETSAGGVILAQQAGTPFGVPSNGWVPQIYVGTDGHLYVQLFWGGAFAQIITAKTVDDGAFHHLAVTYNGANETVYLDGKVVGTEALAYSNYSSNFTCQWGMGYTQGWPAGNGGWFAFNGIIDEPSLYNVALTATQVQSIYNAANGGKCQTAPPSIATQPVSQTVAADGTATFSLSASSLAAITYQWWQGSSPVSGATSPTYALTSVTGSENGSQFSCVVANVYGSVTSSVVTLTVETSSACTPPAAGLVDWWPGEGNAVDIIGGNNGTLVNTVGFASGEVNQGFSFNGGNSYVQLLENLYPMANAKPFSIELWFETSAGGVILAEQAGAPFGVPSNGWVPQMYVGTDGHLYVQLFWDGAFAQIVSGGTVNNGAFHHLAAIYDGANETVYLDGTAIGAEPLAYSSYTANFNCQLGLGYTQGWPAGNGGWFAFNGIIDEPSLYNVALTPAQVQSIYGAGSGGKCQTAPPSITTQPVNQTVAVGGTATFSVSASSQTAVTYQWRQGSSPVSGATSATFALTSVTGSESGDQFSCVVANTYGSVTSAVVTLTVNTPLACTPPPTGLVDWWPGEGNAVDIIGGNSGTLVNGVSFASGEVNQGFSFNGNNSYVQLPENLYPMANAAPFSIELWFETSSGGAILGQQAGAPFGVPNNGWVPQIYVGTDGHLYVQLFWDGAFAQVISSGTVNNGAFHHLAVTYDGANETVYLDGAAIGAKPLTYSSYTANFNCQLGIGYTQGWPAGNGGWFDFNGIIDEPSLYNVVLTPAQVQSIYSVGSGGKCQTAPPSITIQPVNQTVAVGGTATFSISASSLTAETYQWRQGGSPVSGATSATYALTSVIGSESGNQFSCVVANVYGSVTSAVVTLTVETPPVCTPPPTGLVDWWPGDGNATDIIGGNNGTLVNTVAYASGEVGQGFSFTTSSGYVQLPENLYPMANAQPFSIELWFETAAGGVILAQQAGAPFGVPSNGWVPQMYVGTDGHLYVQLFWDGNFAQIVTTGTVNDGTFHHLAVTYDGANETVYLDGKVVGTEALVYSNYTSNFNCQLGMGYTQYWPAGNGGWFAFNGIIDEPSLYNVLLTPAQIQAIYNAGSGGKCQGATPDAVVQPGN
jgi:O-glycosyl hydrolase